MKNLKYATNLLFVVGLGGFFAVSCLDEYGTVNIPPDSSSSSSIASSSSGEGGMFISSSSSSGNTSGAGGSSASSTSSSSSSGTGGVGPCPECSMGMTPACSPKQRGVDDCTKAGELCNGTGACECGISKPVVSICPAGNGWEPGNAGECVRKCDMQGECMNQMLDCPAGFDCLVQCSAQDACASTIVNCPAGHACTLSCSGQDGCTSATFECSVDGPCNLKCDNSSGVCQFLAMHCGNNSCRAVCNGSPKPMQTQAPGTTSCGVTGC